MGNIGFVALRDIGLALQNELKLTTFIETGTYKGQTTRWASENFKKVVTIEASPYFHERALRLFKDIKNIGCIFGDSANKLSGVIKRLKKPVLIYLDAHYCAHEKSVSGVECPLLAELEAIRDTGIDHVILIDDARMFVDPAPGPYDVTQWPSLDDIRAKLPKHYELAIWNDVIFAVAPEALRIVKGFTQVSEMEVIVLTSNEYLHCLHPFAYLFNKFWGAAQPVKVVRYEHRPRGLSGNFSNFSIGIQANYTWSSGLIKYLQHHNEPLVLLMLEDYFIDKSVDTNAVEQLWQLMRNQPEIAKIDLSNDRLKVSYSDFNDYLVKSDDDTLFQTSLQAAIWRKDFLLQFLDPREDSWQFEKRGTKRVINARQSGKFDGVILGCKEPPLSYVNAKGGEGNHPHLWDFKKIPEWMVKELAEKRLM